MRSIWVLGIIMCIFASSILCSDEKFESSSNGHLKVALTLIQSAEATKAVCLDGSLPGYHLHPGFGSGANSWLVHLEGGGYCNDIKSCVRRKKTPLGSSNYMKVMHFGGILSNKPEENPDFYNWNRVMLRYCDGASFSGEGSNEAASLQFRGQRIWIAAMNELMSNGMKNATQALLSGCSAGGLASILHCDQFHDLFHENIRVKCLADAGYFLDAVNVAGGRTLRAFYNGVLTLQGVSQNLPEYCTSRMNATLCFFPENLVANVRAPLFILNPAYDVVQLKKSLAPTKADPRGYWRSCKLNYAKCNESQIQFLQDFRNEMINSIKGVSLSKKNGWFINSCFTHCQTEKQAIWFGTHSPVIENKRIAQSVGDWYFDRTTVKEIDCPYPCDKTCHNEVK